MIDTGTPGQAGRHETARSHRWTGLCDKIHACATDWFELHDGYPSSMVSFCPDRVATAGGAARRVRSPAGIAQAQGSGVDRTLFKCHGSAGERWLGSAADDPDRQTPAPASIIVVYGLAMPDPAREGRQEAAVMNSAVLKDAGIDPAPERTSTTRATFPRSQAQAIIAAHFFRTTTLTGGTAIAGPVGGYPGCMGGTLLGCGVAPLFYW